MFRTVRARLTFITLVIMAVVLALLVWITDFSTRRALLGSIDRELIMRGDDLARIVRNPDNDPPPFPIGQGEPGNPQRRVGQFQGGRGPGRGQGPPRNPFMLMPRVLRVDGSPRPNQPNDPPYDEVTVASVAMSRKPEFSVVQSDEGARRVYSRPVQEVGQVIDVVQVAYPLGDVYENLRQLRLTLLTTIIPVGMLLSGLASLFVVGRFLAPLRRITEDATRIKSMDSAARVSVVGSDEFATLGQTLNSMLDRIEEGFRAEQEVKEQLQEALEIQQRFTADASHELKTPLSVVKANLGLLQHAKGSPEEIKEWLAATDQATNRMAKLVQDLLVLARNDNSEILRIVEPIDFNGLIQEAVSAVPGALLRVRCDLPDVPVLAEGIRDDLLRALINLVDNALRHSGPESLVRITLTELSQSVEIKVIDEGVGISPEDLDHVFDRFYRADKSRNSATGGSGLGLAITKKIAESHGGLVSVESQLGQGSTFRLALPK